MFLSGVFAQVTAISLILGGPVPRYFPIRLKFCAVAVSRNSSWAPLKPRSRKRSTFKMRFMCANSISTFFRCRRVLRYAGVFLTSRATSRALSCTERSNFFAGAFGQHCSFNGHAKQSPQGPTGAQNRFYRIPTENQTTTCKNMHVRFVILKPLVSQTYGKDKLKCSVELLSRHYEKTNGKLAN